MKFGCIPAIVAICLSATLARGQSLVDPSLTLNITYITGLTQPTSFAFLGNNDLFVIEKASGLVKRVQVGGSTSTALDLNVNSNSERGLLGIALSPTFASDNQVYLYYSKTSLSADSSVETNWTGNRISSFTWNGTRLTGETPLLNFDRDAGQNNGANHDGGPLRFGPDGKLYGMTGDLNRDRAEQNNPSLPSTSSSVGGIYRINANGSIPADNPFTGTFNKWYAYGVRNGFGMAFDPVTGALWDTENGPATNDEINKVAKGFNSGWNEIMGPDSLSPGSQANLVQLPGSAYSDPEFTWVDTVAPTGMEFLACAGNAPAYKDLVIVGDVNNGRLYKFTLNAARDGFVFSGSLTDFVANTDGETSSVIWGTGFGSVTDMSIGPDGALYVTSMGNGTANNGNIYRISGVPEPAIIGLLVPALALLTRRVRT